MITRIADLASSRLTPVNSITCDISFSSTLGAIRLCTEQQVIPFKRKRNVLDGDDIAHFGDVDFPSKQGAPELFASRNPGIK